MAAIRVPALEMTGAQLRGVLLALSAASGGVVSVPALPFTGTALRATLLALEAEIGSGATIPALPMAAEDVRAALVEMAAAAGAVEDVPGPLEGNPYDPTASGGGVLTGEAAPGPADGQNGDLYVRSAGGFVTLYGPKVAGDWGDPFAVLDVAPPPPPRRVLLEDPTADENLPLEQATFAAPLTISRVTSYVRGAGASVAFSLRHGDDPDGNGTEVVTGGILAAEGEASLEEFDSPVIPAGHWLWLVTTATTGDVELLTIGIDWAR